VADGGEDGIGAISIASLEIAAAEMDFGFHMADHGLDVSLSVPSIARSVRPS
jgi:hypothetical protein